MFALIISRNHYFGYFILLSSNSAPISINISGSLSLNLSPVPDRRRLGFGCGAAEKQPAEGLSVERKQGPEIAEAAKGGRSTDGQQDKRQACEESRQTQEACA